MSIFMASFVVFGVVMAAMAIGVILSNRRIAGTCGGLANMKTEEGEPMCECGARVGESCGVESERRFIIDEEDSVTEREPAAV